MFEAQADRKFYPEMVWQSLGGVSLEAMEGIRDTIAAMRAVVDGIPATTDAEAKLMATFSSQSVLGPNRGSYAPGLGSI